MMKKTLHNLLIGILLPIFAYCQSESKNPHLLWEITHDKIEGASYLFGSIHLNDSRVFNFDDTLYQALMSCTQFAGEVDMSVLDSLAIIELESEISQDDSSENSTETSEDDNPFDFGFDMDGEITILDFYLADVAQQAGLTLFGLEDLNDQLDILNSTGGQDTSYSFGTPLYEDIVNAYEARDLDIIKGMYHQKDNSDQYDMINRNKIQAKALQKLMLEGNTFAVVGLGHLIGESSVFDYLKENNYCIRQMNFGQTTKALQQLIDSKPDQEWHTISHKNYSLLSNRITRVKNFQHNIDAHISMELNKGLLYMTMFLPATTHDHEDVIKVFSTSMFSDTSNLKINKAQLIQGNSVSTFENLTETIGFMGKLITNGHVSIAQMVIGFSNKSIRHPHATKYLEGLTIKPDAPKDWTTQQSDYGGFEYYFPADIEFQTLQSKMPGHETSGDAVVKYKSFTNPKTKAEYLLRHVTTPPGILYVDPHESIESMNETFKKNYKAEIQDIAYNEINGNLSCDLSLIDKYNNLFYIKTIVRGAVMYNIIQKSPTQEKDNSFFNGFKLIGASENSDSEFSYEDAGFTLKLPPYNSYQNSEKNENSTLDSYGINSSQSGFNIDIEFDEYTPYEMNELEDSTFTSDILDYDVFDSLLFFKKYSYQDICPGYITSFITDSTYLVQTEIGIYCNNHFTDINISIPQEFQNTGLVENIINTIEFSNPSTASITTDKTENIIADLMSRDTNQFRQALAVLQEEPVFTVENIPSFVKLLQTKVLDSDEDYNSKYDLITSFHDIESSEIENALFDLYRKTDNLSVQYRILESLSGRATTNATDKMISLLQQPKLDNLYPEDLLYLLNDSLELFEFYYPKLKSIAEINYVDDTALHSIVKWYIQDTSQLFTQTETTWLTDKINNKIEEYYTNSLIDTSASIHEYIMDYIDVADLPAQEKLFSYIEQSEDVFGQYRVIYYKLQRKENISAKLLDKAMSSEYYKYWLLVNYAEEGAALPEKYLEQHSVATTVMKKYIYDNFGYWCDTATVLKEYSNGEIKHGDMLYVKCDYSEEGQYFIGCVGPFDGQGLFSFDDDESVYYQSIQTAEDPMDLEKELIDYLNKD